MVYNIYKNNYKIDTNYSIIIYLYIIIGYIYFYDIYYNIISLIKPVIIGEMDLSYIGTKNKLTIYTSGNINIIFFN